MKKIFKETYEYTDLGRNESQYDQIDLKTASYVHAAYQKSFIPEDNGNRFIEALPRPRSMENAKLAYNVPLLSYDYEAERAMPSEQRELMVYRLREVRFPLPHQAHLESVVYNALCLSYRSRHRVESEHMGFELDLGNGPETCNSKLLGDSAAATNAGFALLGYSGSGKSSTLNNLLSNYPQVIYHTSNGWRIPQIVYLVVNCVPNSNFSALYVGIGNAIDRALGLDYVYEKMIKSARSLGDKAEKIRQLVEHFAIGLIVFDEIQLIDFSSTKENSFESLMVLANRTKVAIGVVGTTDAYSKMFTSLRTARRVGTRVSACAYCDNRAYFSFLVHNLMRYQWFDSFVEVSDELVDALYAHTHGIIDQLVSIYICMHVEYLRKKRRPTVDAAFIDLVARRYYPQMKELLSNIDDPQSDMKIAEIINDGKKKLEQMQDEAQQKIAADSILKSQAEAVDMEILERRVAANIMNVTDDYRSDTIHSAFVKAVRKVGVVDENAVTKAVFHILQNGHKDARPTSKNKHKPSIKDMQAEIIGSLV